MEIMQSRNCRNLAVGATLLLCGFCGGVGVGIGATHESHGPEKLVFSSKLPNVPGKSLTAVVVSYPPGGKSPAHRHAGSVFAYVLSGKIRSENSATGPVKVYNPGEAFFEPPGSTHTISENGSDSEPASLLAVFVADSGAQLTSMAK
jgi:quercetin dioxygenase-like cupin family protein